MMNAVFQSPRNRNKSKRKYTCREVGSQRTERCIIPSRHTTGRYVRRKSDDVLGVAAEIEGIWEARVLVVPAVYRR